MSGLGNGSNGMLAHNGNGSESFLYGQQQGQQKNGTTSRDGTMTANGTAGARGMGMYDQMERVGEQDEDGGHGRRRGFWSALCCRA